MKHMQEKELEVFRILLKEWYSIPKCADIMWYHKTTLYRLLQTQNIDYKARKHQYIWWRKWNRKDILWEKWKYLRDVGKKKIQFQTRSIHLAREKKKSIASLRYSRIEKWSDLENYIIKHIKKYYSPKQISWRRSIENKSPLSKDTIYSYIYNNYPELVSKYFRRKWKKYQNKRKQKYQIDNRRMLNKRPKSVEKRTTLWHWESDTVVGKRKSFNKKVIITNVERKSGYLIASLSQNSSAIEVSQEIIKSFFDLPKYKRKSIVFDNGREFAYHYDIERETNMTTYFARPYSPWERGTNENTNSLLRQFLPKWSDFSNLTEKELQTYVTLINNRPRERLWFLTPHEVFHNKSKSCVWF